MSSPTAAPARPARKRRTPPPFDPHLAVFEGQEWHGSDHARLAFRCPSRRAASIGYLLTCEEDGSRPWCSCDGHTYGTSCTHSDQAAEIARLVFVNHYASLPTFQLTLEDQALLVTLGPRLGTSIRYGCLGEEIAKRMRMADRPTLNARGQRAKADLFG